MVDTIHPANAVTGAPSYSGRMLRQAGSATKAGATIARPLGGRSGVRPGTDPATVTATTTVWTCKPFAGVADAETAAEAGPYEFAFDANATGAMTPAHASLVRIDILQVRIDDPAESDGSSVPVAVRTYKAGTAGSGVAATPDARCFAIANITVPASGGGSPTVAWVAPYTVAAGGILPFNTLAQLTAYTGNAAAPYAEVVADSITANNGLYRWLSGAWKPWESTWFTWTPTLAGVTLGTGGTAVFEGMWLEGRFEYRWKVTLGTGGTFTGAFSFTLPFTPRNTGAYVVGVPGVTTASDVSATNGTSNLLQRFNAPPHAAVTVISNPASAVNLGASVPITWAIGDALLGEGTVDQS